VLRMTWRSLLARRVRLALSAFAIVLGVAFVAGSFIFTDAMGDAFDGIIEGSTSQVEVAYQGAGSFDAGEDNRTISASVVQRLREVPGVAAVHARDELQSVFVLGRSGKVVGGNGPPGLAFNADGSRSVDGTPIISLSSGRLPGAADEAALDVDTARRAGYVIGDPITLVTPGERPTVRARLVGLVRFGGGGLAGATVTVLDKGLLQQRFFDGRDVYTQVSLDLEPGATQASVAAAAQRVVPTGVEARTGDDLVKANKAQLDQLLGYLNTFLLVFAAVSLVVGTYLIVNTFSILVAQRSRELALLRALGASRRQVNLSVLVEAVAVGTFGSTVGLGAGYLLARGLQLLFAAVGLDLGGASFPVNVRTVVASYAVGVLVTVVAAYLPARRASRIAPVAALRDEVALPESSLRRRVLVGIVLVVLGAASMTVGLRGDGNTGLAEIGLGMLAVLVGVSLLSPWLGRPLTSAFSQLYRRVFGTVGLLAAQNSLRNPRRTAATASALMIGLTLVSLMAILGTSASASTDAAVKRSLTSQLVVSNVVGQPFSAAIAPRIRKVEGVRSVAVLRTANATVEGRRVFVGAVDPRDLGLAVAVPTRQGSLLALKPGTVALSAAAAERGGYRIGSSLPLKFQGGTVRVRVVAVFGRTGLLGSNYLVTPDTLVKGGLRPLDTLLFVTTSRSAATGAVRRDVERIIRDLPTVTVQDPAQVAEQQRSQINTFLYFIDALLGLALIVAVLGIVNTLALSVIERTREVGLLRAVGLSRAQLRRMVRLEAVIIAVLGAALGVAMGLVFGIALQRAISDQGIDVLSIPWLQLVVYVVVAALAGVLAAVLPARRAARLDVLQAISTE